MVDHARMQCSFLSINRFLQDSMGREVWYIQDVSGAWMRNLIFIGFAVTLAVGCGASMSSTAKESTDKFPPPHIRLGPTITVADTPVEKVSATMDNVGRAHLLVAMKSPKEIEYVVVDPDGLIHREPLTGYNTPARTFIGRQVLKLDIATDGKGRLRAVVEDNALILEGGAWQQAGKTPCRQYVRAGSAFYCAFISPGKDVGASTQWEWFGFGGYPAGIIFPWPSYPDKLVIFREDGDTWGQTTVIDPNLKGDVDMLHGYTLAGDARGTVHLVYERGWAVIFDRETETRYVRLPSTTGSEGDRVSSEAASSDSITHGGYYSTKVTPYSKIADFKIAADPDSGAALLVYRYGSQKIHGDRFGLPRDLPLAMGSEPRVASAGAGDFHLVILGEPRNQWSWSPRFPIYYLSNKGSVWSSPVELGDGALMPNDTFLLVSDASRRAFVTWATDNGLVGRWVELEDREASESPREKPESGINMRKNLGWLHE